MTQKENLLDLINDFGDDIAFCDICDRPTDDYDFCYECRKNGNDYYVDDDGDLVSACDDCFYYDWSD